MASMPCFFTLAPLVGVVEVGDLTCNCSQEQTCSFIKSVSHTYLKSFILSLYMFLRSTWILYYRFDGIQLRKFNFFFNIFKNIEYLLPVAW